MMIKIPPSGFYQYIPILDNTIQLNQPFGNIKTEI